MARRLRCDLCWNLYFEAPMPSIPARRESVGELSFHVRVRDSTGCRLDVCDTCLATCLRGVASKLNERVHAATGHLAVAGYTAGYKTPSTELEEGMETKE